MRLSRVVSGNQVLLIFQFCSNLLLNLKPASQYRTIARKRSNVRIAIMMGMNKTTKRCQTIKLLVCSLGIFLFWVCPAQAQRILSPGQIFSPGQAQSQPVQTVLSDLAAADVVYLGETHDRPIDHQTQLAIIQALHQTHPQLAIGMEMFQRPYQAVLDRYLAGEITEAELRQQSQYDQRWGFPWENYAPILRYAQANHLPVLALNTPTEVTRRVAARGFNGLSRGWDDLSPDDRQWIPPASEIHTDNPDYRQFLQAIYNEFHADYGSVDRFDQFVLAQVLWDETMAASIADFLQSHPQTPVVVLTGQGHVMYGYGIPSRVARRLGSGLVQRSILLNPTTDATQEAGIADYLWFSPDQ
jgi:uncharacterized iron-regulated protein